MQGHGQSNNFLHNSPGAFFKLMLFAKLSLRVTCYEVEGNFDRATIRKQENETSEVVQ